MSRPQFRRVVPETYVQLLYEYLQTRGQNPDIALGHPWPVPARQGEGGVSVLTWEEMLETTEVILEDPFIAIHVGETITTRHLGILGSVILASENLGAALVRLERYQRLIFDVVPMSVVPVQTGVEVVWDVSDFQPGRHVAELGLAVMTQTSRSLVRGSKVSPLAVRFSHPAPEVLGPYEAFFQCPVLFDQTNTALLYSYDCLGLPLKSPDPALIAVLERHADGLLAQLPHEPGIVEEVRRQIALALRGGHPTVEWVAGRLDTSARTLQRKLTRAGSSFRRELNVVRHQLARSYLIDQRLKVVDVALLLGYAEQSAFTRAYKEWTGLTPQQEKAGAEQCGPP
ncbi:AraC family transcriptional regulator [Pseudomonas sp. BGM005]|nr:AraC family transcriptional regulator [Pseudomonas sp. BG5]